MKSYLVVIPTYNERGNVAPLARKIKEALQEAHIIFVDDDSPDGTGDLVRSLASDDKTIHLIQRKGSRGYGTACVSGMKFGLSEQFEYIIQMDADFSHSPGVLPFLVRKVEGGQCDVAVGSRYMKSGRVVANWSLLREILSRGGNWLARFLLRIPIRDLTSGYRCYRSEVLREVDLDSIKSNGYAFLIETIYRCHRNGCKIGEVPIVYIDREYGSSKLSRRIIIEALFLVIRLFLTKMFGKVRRAERVTS